MLFRLTVLLLAFGLGFSTSTQAAETRAGFTIGFQDIRSDLSILTTAVMPGASLRIETQAEATADIGSLSREGPAWLWQAPAEPGRAELRFSQAGDRIRLNIFILTPFVNGQDESLEGYRIGRYASTLFRGLSSYAAPRGFINLAHGPADLQVSPHFTLGQFICKQQPGHDPTFLLLRPAMLVKLEALLEAANARGWPGESFFIMSGFRTPYYNRSIGNDTSSSRHLYGGAADIWLDADGDGQMDDLNRDGVIDKNDARELARLAESLAGAGGPNWPRGGIGIYGANAAHGPFVHIDARGYRARWD